MTPECSEGRLLTVTEVDRPISHARLTSVCTVMMLISVLLSLLYRRSVQTKFERVASLLVLHEVNYQRAGSAQLLGVLGNVFMHFPCLDRLKGKRTVCAPLDQRSRTQESRWMHPPRCSAA